MTPTDSTRWVWCLVLVLFFLWFNAFVLSFVMGFMNLARGIRSGRTGITLLGMISLTSAPVGAYLVCTWSTAGLPFFLCILYVVCSFTGWRMSRKGRRRKE